MYTPLPTTNLTENSFQQSGEARDENSVTDEINITWAVPKVRSLDLLEIRTSWSIEISSLVSLRSELIEIKKHSTTSLSG